MKYSQFTIGNFKGIDTLTLKLDKVPNPNIFTLVGLNESGKTTILEAVNYFQNSSGDVNTLIPKSKRANFNGTITIDASLKTNLEDEELIKKFAKQKGYEIEDINDFTISRTYNFSKSTFTKKDNLWTIKVAIKSLKRPGNFRVLTSKHKFWQAIVAYIRDNLMPTIVYYPNFLFDFPTAIYLEKYEGEGVEQEFYRKVLQDVLDTLKQDLLLKDHLIDRKREGTKNDLENIEKVLNDMSGKITQLVFEAWKRVSGLEASNISVTLGNDIKVDENSRLYIEIKIKEGTDSYYISERSLGFRWFFAFLLFTQFRKHRSTEVGNMLFLLDEPASNLHQSGQQELLASLEQLTDGSMVIYSTHSHHLVNPKWLAGAFIVKNKGLSPDAKTLEDDFNATKTNITAERYYSFVAKYPKEETHFKPILDVLDYKPSKIENVPNIIIPEGKFDFYLFSYFQDVVLCLRKEHKVNFYPGAGKDKHDNIIALYLAWGRKFLVLLDSDAGGKVAKQRYIKDFGEIVKDKIYTLDDVDSTFNNFTTENLIPEQERIDFTKTIFPIQNRYDKLAFNNVIQQNYIGNVNYAFSDIAKQNINKVITYLKLKLT